AADRVQPRAPGRLPLPGRGRRRGPARDPGGRARMTEPGSGDGGGSGRGISPRLDPHGPLELVGGRLLFQGGVPRRRNCATLHRLASGRILLAFAQTRGADLANDAAVMLSWTDDDGRTWAEPEP